MTDGNAIIGFLWTAVISLISLAVVSSISIPSGVGGPLIEQAEELQEAIVVALTFAPFITIIVLVLALTATLMQS